MVHEEAVKVWADLRRGRGRSGSGIWQKRGRRRGQCLTIRGSDERRHRGAQSRERSRWKRHKTAPYLEFRHRTRMDTARLHDSRRRLQRFVVALTLDSPFVSPRESLLSSFFEKKIISRKKSTLIRAVLYREKILLFRKSDPIIGSDF